MERKKGGTKTKEGRIYSIQIRACNICVGKHDLGDGKDGAEGCGEEAGRMKPQSLEPDFLCSMSVTITDHLLTLGKVFRLIQPSFPHFFIEDNKNTFFIVLPRILRKYYKVLRTTAFTNKCYIHVYST